jgi:hypothetical protein
LTPLANLLMRSDRETASAIRRLPTRDFGRIDPRSSRAVAAAETVARAHRELVQQIAEGGQQVIVDRMSALGVAPATLSSFVQSFSPQLVVDANRRWFNSTPDQTHDSASSGGHSGEVRQAQFEDLSMPPSSILQAAPGKSDLLGGDELLGTDPLGSDPLALKADEQIDSPKRFDVHQMMPAGGWFRDDVRLAIRYRGGGHEDPVLKSAIEMISQLSPEDSACQQLLQTPAVAACIACHPGAISSSGSWQSNPLIGRKSEFTKFRHAPHLNVAQLADCSHCHRVGSEVSNANLPSGMIDLFDFAPLGREACAACHTPHAAGDACTKCHRYHIDLR